MSMKRLMNVVSMLTKDENMPEANSNEDNEMPKLTVLDDYEEMMKGRQKELNSLKEMGTMTVVKRSEAVGKRTIQARWVDRKKDGTSEIKVSLERLQSMSGAYTARDVFTNTVNVVSENDAGCELTRQKTMIRSRTTSQFRSTYTQHSCTRMSTKTCLQNRQNQMSGMTQD